jgi:hypothetical protein
LIRLAFALVVGTLLVQPCAARGKVRAPELVMTALAEAQQAIEHNRPADALAKLNQIKLDELDPKQRGAVQLQRAVAYAQYGRASDMKIALSEARHLLPGDIAPVNLQWLLAKGMGETKLAIEALDYLIDNFPADAQLVDSEQLWPFIRRLKNNDNAAEANRLTLRLAAIGYGGDNFVDRDGVALSAIEILLDQSDVEKASYLASNIVDRQFLVTLLTRRKYSALWPSIERRIDEGMRLPLVQAVFSGENWMKREPDSLMARRTLMIAYQNAGRLTDADRTAATFAATPDEMSRIDEAGGWLINDHAYTLLAMNKPEASDARFASLATIDIKQAPWLISMLINRAELLIQSGRIEKADSLLTQLTSQAQQFGSPYAIQLVRRMTACVAHRKKKPEAEALIKDMIAYAKDARSATAEGLLCVGRREDAAALAVAALSDPDEADGMIDTLRPPLPLRDPSKWGAPDLLAYPAVLAAIDKLARPLPAQLVVKEPVD